MDDALVENVAKAIDIMLIENSNTCLDKSEVLEIAKAAIQATGVMEMQEALQGLVDETVEYIEINNLYDDKGRPARNATLRRAQNVLSNQDT